MNNGSVAIRDRPGARDSYSLGNCPAASEYPRRGGFLAEGFPASPQPMPRHSLGSRSLCPALPLLLPFLPHPFALLSIRIEKSLSAPSVGSIRRRRTNRHFSLLVYTDKIWEGMWLQPRIRREIVPVEEHLSSDGVREPEGRSDREDIEIVGRVTDIDATKYDDLLLLLGVLLTINFSDRTTVPRVILFTATST